MTATVAGMVSARVTLTAAAPDAGMVGDIIETVFPWEDGAVPRCTHWEIAATPAGNIEADFTVTAHDPAEVAEGVARVRAALEADLFTVVGDPVIRCD